MAVLVTRPMPETARTAARLQALGHETICMPVLKILPLVPQWPENSLRVPVDALLATSAHAFHHVLPEDWQDLPLLVVGDHTAQAALAHRGPVFSAAGDRHDLVARARAQGFQHFIYLAGRDRKPELERDLAQFARITIVETYVAQAAVQLSAEVLAALGEGRINIVLHYSRRSCEIFLKLVNAADLTLKLAKIRHICLSEDVAKPLLAQGLAAERAEMPNEDHLFAVLLR